jgi:hypothetical protein
MSLLVLLQPLLLQQLGEPEFCMQVSITVQIWCSGFLWA